MPNISQRRVNKTMKLGQLIKDNTRNTFLQKSCRKWSMEASSRPLFVFQTSFICAKRKRSFDFLEKGQGIVSSPYFTYDFSRKMFPMLYSNNWPNFIVWLPLLFEIFRIMCIWIVCFPGCMSLSFKNNRILLIKSFFYLTKTPR